MLTVIAIVVIIAGLLLLGASRPDTFRIQRSTSINATPEKVTALIADFHHWSSWSPWEKLDPALSRKFGGATAGKGAVYEWEGNKKVGKGRMEITGLSENAQILIKLDFFAPFEAHNTAEFTLHQHDGATNIIWAMYGPASFPVKVMHLFMNMDRMVGKDFEAGLASLKALAEK